MKTIVYKIALALVFSMLLGTTISAQGIQRVFGTALDNSFTKVIRSGTNYYVLGRDEPTNGALTRATVTRLNALGEHQWTLSLDIASVWNDAVLTPGGNLLVVGNTLPLDATSQSLMGLVTPAGAFSWVRSYNVPGREWFNRVVLNPMPANSTFPYYVLGGQWDPAGNANWDDIVLLTVSEAGNFGWKKIYTGLFGTTDDEFSRDLEALPNGDLILAGNLGTNGVIFRSNNAGEMVNSAGPEGILFSFADVTQISGGFYAVGHTYPSVSAHLMKFDADLLVTWQIIIPQLTAVSQVWTDTEGKIYVTGRATVGGLNRGVLLKYQEVGGNPSLLWMKYLEYNDLSYNGGSAWYMPPSQIAFADGRERVVGFGEGCAFFSISSDLELTTCMTETAAATQASADLFFFSLLPPDIDFFDTPPATNLTSSALNWQQDNACPPPPCVAEFIIQKVGNCFYFQTNNNSSGPPPLTYQWNFGDPASGSNNTSMAQNPDHVFSGCGTYTVCLTVTGAGCTASVCHTVTTTDITPPSISCPQSTNYQCGGDVPPLGLSLVIASDNCTPPQSIIITATQSVNGVMPCDASIVRTWVAQDLCGNTSACTQTIFVSDTQAPVLLNCPSPVVNVQCTNQVPLPAIVTAIDNCAPNVTITFTEVVNGVLPCNASIVRTWMAADACFNTTACVQTIFVNDNQAPLLFSCPPNLSVNTNPGVCYFTGVLPKPTANDNCPTAPQIFCFLVTPNQSIPITPQTQFPKGNNTITCYAEDACGNQSQSCSFILTVNDNVPPTMQCPPPVVNYDCEEDVPLLGSVVVTATDNCTPAASITITASEVVNGILPCDASIVRTWVAADTCGNTSICTQTIFVNDDQAPVLVNCPPSVVNVQCTNQVPPPAIVVAIDNCAPAPSLTFSEVVNGIIPCDAAIIRTWTAEDLCGNTVACSQTIFVHDTQAPVLINCPPSVVHFDCADKSRCRQSSRR
ncbi:MAG: PKD domain-containing protein [Lewinellaceae bacterium]|nr:PKD domain-containing protein [Lewinellaceae bacterium]